MRGLWGKRVNESHSCMFSLKNLVSIHKNKDFTIPQNVRSFLILTFICHSHLIVLLAPSLLSQVVVLWSLRNCMKIANRSFYHFAPVLWNSLPSHLCFFTLHSISALVLDSCISDLSISCFLKKMKSHIFCIFFLITHLSSLFTFDRDTLV